MWAQVWEWEFLYRLDSVRAARNNNPYPPTEWHIRVCNWWVHEYDCRFRIYAKYVVGLGSFRYLWVLLVRNTRFDQIPNQLTKTWSEHVLCILAQIYPKLPRISPCGPAFCVYSESAIIFIRTTVRGIASCNPEIVTLVGACFWCFRQFQMAGVIQSNVKLENTSIACDVFI